MRLGLLGCLRMAAVGAVGLLASNGLSAHSEFELVHTAPVHTELETPDLAEPVKVWCELFDGAHHSIDLGEFYASAGPNGSRLNTVLEHLQQAGRRGVKIRFLLEAKGLRMSDPTTLARLKAIPNLQLRTLDYSKLTGDSIIHAKYMVIDGKQAYVGSQNFDWRSLQHIHETGLRISDTVIATQVQAIFNQDWTAQAEVAAGRSVPVLNHDEVRADIHQPAFLVASPNAYNPVGVGDSQQALVDLLGQAKQEVRIQVLTYAPLEYVEHGRRQFYPVIDNALRAAAQRGVKIKLMVSSWNTGKPAIDYLKSLAVLPNVEVRAVTLPQDPSGFIPFARVIHTKTMEIDDQIAWVGTSNWEGGYMDKSRNLEVVLRDPAMATRIDQLHQQLWNSSYARPIDVNQDYPRPHPGTP